MRIIVTAHKFDKNVHNDTDDKVYQIDDDIDVEHNKRSLDFQQQKIKSQMFGSNTILPCFTKGMRGVTGSIHPLLSKHKASVWSTTNPIYTNYFTLLTKCFCYETKLNYLATDLRLKLDFKLERFRDCQCNFCSPLSRASAAGSNSLIHKF